MKNIRTIAQYKEDIVAEGIASSEIIYEKYLFSKTHYDESGQVVLQEQFDKEGEVSESVAQKYASGKLIEIKSTIEGEVAEHRTFEYEDGKLKTEKVFYTEGGFDTITYEYQGEELVRKVFVDEDGEKEKEVVFSREGDVYKEITFDEEGMEIEEKSQKKDGQHILEEMYHDHFTGEKYRVVFEYDDQGREVKTLRYNESEKLIDEVVRTYDDKGNVAFVSDSMNNKEVRFVHDDNANITFQEETLKDGTVLSSVKRVFGDAGEHLKSEVYVNGMGYQISQNYIIHHEYEYFK